MTLYVVMWRDRVSNTEAFPFLDLDRAKHWIRERFRSWQEEGFSVGELEEDRPPAGWLYLARYAGENRIWIVAKDVIE